MSRRQQVDRRRGVILIATIVIVFAIAVMALALGNSIRVEAQAAANAAAAREAGLIARGAEQYVLALLAESLDPPEALPESYFAEVPLGGGAFWIVRPDYNDPELPAFGLVDETAKVDLNTATYDQLILLPGMTEPLAAAIIDWRDEDDEVEQGIGAESQTYLGRNPPYRAKNAPFESVEELLLVEGMTPELLWGQVDQPPLGEVGVLGITGGIFESELYRIRGLAEFVTVWSATPTTGPDGRDRVNVAGPPQAVRGLVNDIIGPPRASEINARIIGPSPFGILRFAADAGLTVDEFRQLEPYLAHGGEGGEINLNTAPREVLLATRTPEDVLDAVLSRRAAAVATEPGSMAWALEGATPASLPMGPLTARGTTYSADIVAVSGTGRAFRRVRIVVDTSGGLPQIVHRRDLTTRGWPLNPDLLDVLRAGGR